MGTKKRKAVYDPEAQKRWREKNRNKSNHNAYKSTARTFIRNHATLEEVEELRALLDERVDVLLDERVEALQAEA